MILISYRTMKSFRWKKKEVFRLETGLNSMMLTLEEGGSNNTKKCILWRPPVESEDIYRWKVVCDCLFLLETSEMEWWIAQNEKIHMFAYSWSFSTPSPFLGRECFHNLIVESLTEIFLEGWKGQFFASSWFSFVILLRQTGSCFWRPATTFREYLL